MAPPFGQAIKTQTMKRFANYGLIVITKAVVNDVPMTDCFYVEDCLLVSTSSLSLSSSSSSSSSNPGSGSAGSSGGTGSTVLTSMYDIKFVKSTMYKKIITMMSVNDLNKFHRGFLESIKNNVGVQSQSQSEREREEEEEEEWREATDAANAAYSQIIVKVSKELFFVFYFFYKNIIHLLQLKLKFTFLI